MKSEDTNGAARRSQPIPLELLEDNDGVADDDTEYIVVGEEGEEVAFEICEDIDMALAVRELMREDGFAVRLYQAIEIIVDGDSEAAPPKAAQSKPRNSTGARGKGDTAKAPAKPGAGAPSRKPPKRKPA